MTVRIDDELDKWLEEAARKRGVSKGKLVRDQLERGRKMGAEKPFMRLAGAIDGPSDLSVRKGFSKA